MNTNHVIGGDRGLGKLSWRNYIPLIVIVSIILLVTVTLTLRDFHLERLQLESSISYFMIGFFLTFATFKLIDVPGFAEGYKTYDLLAQKLPVYGYLYPFIELGFGLGMILFPLSKLLLVFELVLMLFSGLGVLIKILKKEEFTCACLGTFLKVPLTKITIIEDFGMAALALAVLLLT